MPIPRLPTLLAAAAGILLALALGWLLLSPPLPLIAAARFDRESISPNADGQDDVAIFEYRLSRPATISLSLAAEDGRIFHFRERQARGEGDYAVQFSGVVDGYLNEGESVAGAIERRLIPNGEYQWRLEATTDSETASAAGSLLVEDGDTPLPTMSEFAIAPDSFTPNQDGVNDRVSINVYLDKDVARLDVFLLGPDAARIPISARVEERQYGEGGRHRYDYEGGIDLGVDPPPDGTYTVVALAQDKVGQRIRRQGQLAIELGGKPYAEIAPQRPGVDVAFAVQPFDARYAASAHLPGDLLPMPDDPAAYAGSQQLTVPLGDMLVFRLTVENYGDVPIRTSGPPPGTVYRQQQLAGSLDYFDESGAWRVGIQCQTSTTSFPWRWAIAPDEALTEVLDPSSGNTFRYLPAGQRAVVWGGIQLTEAEARNPQNCWAGLIHEDVAISLRNNHVGMRSIMILDPAAEARS